MANKLVINPKDLFDSASERADMNCIATFGDGTQALAVDIWTLNETAAETLNSVAFEGAVDEKGGQSPAFKAQSPLLRVTFIRTVNGRITVYPEAKGDSIIMNKAGGFEALQKLGLKALTLASDGTIVQPSFR